MDIHRAIIWSSLAGGSIVLGTTDIGNVESASVVREDTTGLNKSAQRISRSSRSEVDGHGSGSETTCLRVSPGNTLRFFLASSLPASEKRRLREDRDGVQLGSSDGDAWVLQNIHYVNRD